MKVLRLVKSLIAFAAAFVVGAVTIPIYYLIFSIIGPIDRLPFLVQDLRAYEYLNVGIVLDIAVLLIPCARLQKFKWGFALGFVLTFIVASLAVFAANIDG